MKKKIAVLLASTMALSMVPINVYAATPTYNWVTNFNSNAGSNGHLFFEKGSGVSTTNVASPLFVTPDSYTDADSVVKVVANAATDEVGFTYKIDGSDLVLDMYDSIRVGTEFQVSLSDDSKFAFASPYGISTANAELYNKLMGSDIDGDGDATTNPNPNPNFANIALFGSPLPTALTGIDETAVVLTRNTETGLTTPAEGFTADRYTATGNVIKALNPSTTDADAKYVADADVTAKMFIGTYIDEFGVWLPESNSYVRYGEKVGKLVMDTAVKDDGSADKTVGATAGKNVVAAAGAYVPRLEIPYIMKMTSTSQNKAIVKVLWDGSAGGENTETPALNKADTRYQYDNDGSMGRFYEIRIPLVVKSLDDNSSLAVTVTAPTAGAEAIRSSESIPYAGIIGGSTKFTVDPAAIPTARNDFYLSKLTIKENRVGSIKNGKFTLIAPAGFVWDAQNLNGVKLTTVYGLSWKTAIAGDAYESSRTVGNGFTINYSNDNAYYGTGYQRDKLEVTLTDINASTNVNGTTSMGYPGSLALEGLHLIYEGDDNGNLGDVKIALKNGYYVNGSIIDADKAGVSNHDALVVAKRQMWSSALTAGTPTELVNGRYISDEYMYGTSTTPDFGKGMLNANLNPTGTNIHKTAQVTFTEASSNSWWSGRRTVFTLSDNAKFRRLEFSDAGDEDGVYNIANVVNNMNYNYAKMLNATEYPSSQFVSKTQVTPKRVFINDGERHGILTLSDNTITIDSLVVEPGKLGKLVFDLWVSLESGKGGDSAADAASNVELYVGTEKVIPDSGTTAADDPTISKVTIAKSINPVKVTTEAITNLKIGYQYQQTKDIIIKENVPGALLANKQVLLNVTDGVSSDVVFMPGVKVEVTEGNIGISKGVIGTNGVASRPFGSTSLSTGNLGMMNNASFNFNVLKTSTVASTIKVSNVSVKLDRTVPETNALDYSVLVWGTAIAENYGPGRDEFQTAGIATPYTRIVTSATDKPTVLTQEVSLKVGDKFYYVGAEPFEMAGYNGKDTVPYEEDGTIYVPVKFVANAFGLRGSDTDESSQILWDQATQTVTLIAPTKIIQFTAGKSTMKINGADVTMTDVNGKPVVAVNDNGRVYVPFRAAGNAFGVPVSYDTETATAYYNRSANEGMPGEAQPISNPTATTTPAATTAQ